MTYKYALIKRKAEYVLIFPFVFAGRIYGRLFPLREARSVFLFFSSADIGGAIQVNADISRCIADRDPLIIFSKKPKNNGYIHLFDGFRSIDLHPKIDNKLYHFLNFFYRGVLASWINRSKDPVVFGGECLFFYKMIPHLKKEVKRIELCHLATWLPYSIGFIDGIDKRIFSTARLKQEVIAQYQQNSIAPAMFERLQFIENKIDIPPYSETNNPVLEVLFVGRGAPQKRVPLIAAIARKLHDQGAAIHFSFVGDVEKVMDPGDYPFCRFYGNIRDEAMMHSLYSASDVLILTSAYEGLPL